jgi:hypothetical protein
MTVGTEIGEPFGLICRYFRSIFPPIAPPPVAAARTSSQADHGRLLPWLLVEMITFWSKLDVLIL